MVDQAASIWTTCRKPPAQRFYDQVEKHGPVVPRAGMAEVANVVRRGKRRNRISATDVAVFMDVLSLPRIQPDDSSSWRTMKESRRLSRVHGLAVHDAVYLELALRRGPPLAARDADLRKGGRGDGRGGGVKGGKRTIISILSPRFLSPRFRNRGNWYPVPVFLWDLRSRRYCDDLVCCDAYTIFSDSVDRMLNGVWLYLPSPVR